MEALSKHGVPIPPLHGLCQDSSVLGTPFYLMSYVPGRIFKDPSLPGLSSEDRRKVYAAMNRTIAQVGWQYEAQSLMSPYRSILWTLRQLG